MSSQDLPGFGERVPLEAGGGTRSSLARERGGKEMVQRLMCLLLKYEAQSSNSQKPQKC